MFVIWKGNYFRGSLSWAIVTVVSYYVTEEVPVNTGHCLPHHHHRMEVIHHSHLKMMLSRHRTHLYFTAICYPSKSHMKSFYLFVCCFGRCSVTESRHMSLCSPGNMKLRLWRLSTGGCHWFNSISSQGKFNLNVRKLRQLNVTTRPCHTCFLNTHYTQWALASFYRWQTAPNIISDDSQMVCLIIEGQIRTWSV